MQRFSWSTLRWERRLAVTTRLDPSPWSWVFWHQVRGFLSRVWRRCSRGRQCRSGRTSQPPSWPECGRSEAMLPFSLPTTKTLGETYSRKIRFGLSPIPESPLEDHLTRDTSPCMRSWDCSAESNRSKPPILCQTSSSSYLDATLMAWLKASCWPLCSSSTKAVLSSEDNFGTKDHPFQKCSDPGYSFSWQGQCP